MSSDNLNPRISYNKNQQYNPYQIPADLKESEQHLQAQKIGKLKNMHDQKICECCKLQINKEPYPLLVDTRQFNDLGTSYSLYFDLNKLMFIMVLVIFLVVGLTQVIQMANFCKEEECLQFLFIVYASNESNYLNTTVQSWLDIIVILFLIIYFGWVKVYLKNTAIAEEGQQFQKLAIMVKNFDEESTTEEELQRHFDKLTGNSVVKTVFFYKIRSHLKNREKKADILKKQTLLQNQQEELNSKINVQVDQDKKDKLNEQQEKLKQQIKDNREEIYDIDQSIFDFERSIELNKYGHLALSKAIVVFNEVKTQESIMKTYKVSQFKKFMYMQFGRIWGHKHNQLNKRELVVEQAPEPMDLIYENQEFGFWEKFGLRIASNLFVLGLIALSFLLLSLVMVLQVQEYKKTDDISIVYGFMCSGVILIINTALRITISLEVIIERQETYTKFYNSMCWKLSISQFVTACVLPYYLFIQYSDDFNRQELLQNIFFLFIANCFVLPASLLFDPLHMYLSFRKFLVRRNPGNYYQFQANEIYEPAAWDIAEKYAALNKTVLSALFFMPIFPQGAVLELFSLLLQYWASKYILIRKCGHKHKVSKKFLLSMIQLLQFSPFLFTSGMFLELYLVNDKWLSKPFQQILCIILSFLGFFMHLLIRQIAETYKTYKKKSKPVKESKKQDEETASNDSDSSEESETERKIKLSENFTYEESIQLYGIDYDIANPVTCLKLQQQIKNKQTKQDYYMQDFQNVVDHNLNTFQQFGDNDYQLIQQIQIQKKYLQDTQHILRSASQQSNTSAQGDTVFSSIYSSQQQQNNLQNSGINNNNQEPLLNNSFSKRKMNFYS